MPKMYYRSMDDTFVEICNGYECNLFLHSLNSLWTSLRWTFEKQFNLALPFLDVLVKKSSSKFISSFTENPHSPVNIYAGIPAVHRNAKVT